MGTQPDSNDLEQARDFRTQADLTSHGLAREFMDFLRHNKKWWLVPIVVMLLLVAGIVILGGTAAAPFIYTLF